MDGCNIHECKLRMYYHHSWSEIHLVARNQSQILNSYTHCETKLEELHEIVFTNILREQKLQFGSWSEEKFQTLQVAHLSGDWAPFLAWLASCEVCRVFFGVNWANIWLPKTAQIVLLFIIIIMPKNNIDLACTPKSPRLIVLLLIWSFLPSLVLPCLPFLPTLWMYKLP